MKQLLIALLVTTITSTSFTALTYAAADNKIEVSSSIENEPNSAVETVGAFGTIISNTNIWFHKAIFWLADHPCIETKDCNTWWDYKYVAHHTKYLISKIMVVAFLSGPYFLATKGALVLHEAMTRDGAKNVGVRLGMRLTFGVGFLYLNDYVEGLRGLPPERKMAILNDLEAIASITPELNSTDYETLKNTEVLATLGVGDLFGADVINSMINSMIGIRSVIGNGSYQKTDPTST